MAFGSTKTAQGTRTLPDQDDRRALEDAVDVYWMRVCATLYRLVADWDEAEDLALEVFCRLYERPPRERRGLGSWLYRVATNLGLNALRSRQRRRRHEGAAEVLKLQREDPVDPAREVERLEEREQVRQVLAQMKPRAAKLLILHHSGLSYGEIADALSLAPGSVGTLLARAEKDFERLCWPKTPSVLQGRCLGMPMAREYTGWTEGWAGVQRDGG